MVASRMVLPVLISAMWGCSGSDSGLEPLQSRSGSGTATGPELLQSRVDGLAGVTVEAADVVVIHWMPHRAWEAVASNHEKIPTVLDEVLLKPDVVFDQYALRIPRTTETGVWHRFVDMPKTAMLQWRTGVCSREDDPGCPVSKARNHEGDLICSSAWSTQTILGGESGRGNLKIKVDALDVQAGGKINVTVAMWSWNQFEPDGEMNCIGSFGYQLTPSLDESFAFPNEPGDEMEYLIRQDLGHGDGVSCCNPNYEFGECAPVIAEF